MPRSSRLSMSLGIVLLAAVPVLAQNLRVNGRESYEGPLGTTFLFQGYGFTPGRPVKRVLYDTATGLRTELPGEPRAANARGEVAWSFTPRNCNQAGSFFVLVVDNWTRRSSNWVYEGVNACNPTLAVNQQVSASLPLGGLFTFAGTGYTPRQWVSRTLVTRTTGLASDLGDVQANPAGQVSWSFVPTSCSQAGTFDVVARDRTSGRTSNRVLETVTAPNCSEICPGVSADRSGSQPAADALIACIRSGRSTLALPPGVYQIDKQVLVTRPLRLTTRGLDGSTQSCEQPGVSCAVLRAGPSVLGKGGFIRVERPNGVNDNVVFDHIVLDGNRGARLRSQAAAYCADPKNNNGNQWGMNATFERCLSCGFQYSVSRDALCGSGLQWTGDDAWIVNNTFRDNGANASTVPIRDKVADTRADAERMFADGLTLLDSSRAVVQDNRFVNNTDIGLVVGNGQYSSIERNFVQQRERWSYAGIMLHNFSNSRMGNFVGTSVSGNTVECGLTLSGVLYRQCVYGIAVGPHAWDKQNGNIQGGTVIGNQVTAARVGIGVDGAGTAANPTVIYRNTVRSVPAKAWCIKNSGPYGPFTTTGLNISVDSRVDRWGDTSPASRVDLELCH